MFAGQTREQTRAVFFRAWRAHLEGRPLAGLEKLIVQIVLQHPEYHELLNQSETAHDRDYHPGSGAANPFLHLGMHIAIEEQLSIDQPLGIRDYYQAMLIRLPDEHAVQHRMMDCLSEMLWQANRQAATLSSVDYLECLHRLLEAV
ncbi:MAG: DUF1841 family protein [Sulfuricaulis sp.]